MVEACLDTSQSITKPWSRSTIHPILSTMPYTYHTYNSLSMTYSYVQSCSDRSLAFWEIHTEEVTNKLSGLPATVTCVEVDDRHDIGT